MIIPYKIKEFAKQEGISINQFIASAVSEKISAFATVEYLENRAKQADDQKYQAAINKISDVEPEAYDKL